MVQVTVEEAAQRLAQQIEEVQNGEIAAIRDANNVPLAILSSAKPVEKLVQHPARRNRHPGTAKG